MNGNASPTINTFDDLLFVVNTRPEWRQQLVAALFPHLDIEATLRRIDETNRLLRQDIALFEKRMDKSDKELVQVNEQNHIRIAKRGPVIEYKL